MSIFVSRTSNLEVVTDKSELERIGKCPGCSECTWFKSPLSGTLYCSNCPTIMGTTCGWNWN